MAFKIAPTQTLLVRPIHIFACGGRTAFPHRQYKRQIRRRKNHQSYKSKSFHKSYKRKILKFSFKRILF
jgi:hypothetical protein